MTEQTDVRSPLDRAISARNAAKAARDPRGLVDTRRIEVPVDARPETVRGDPPGLSAAREALAAIHGTWSTSQTAAADPDTDTVELASLSTRAVETALRHADQAIGALDNVIAATRSQIDRAVTPPVEPTLAAEIRAHFKADPNRALDAVRTDLRAASAILSAPPYLSGLDDQRFKAVRDIAVKTHAAESVATLEAAEAAHARVTRQAQNMSGQLSERIRVWQKGKTASLKELRELVGGRS